MRTATLGSLFIFFICTLFQSCTHDADISGFPDICFEGEVLPVFLNSCATTNCHDGQGESDLILSGYQDIMYGISPGDPGASEIYRAITSSSGENQMPPDQPLTQDNRTLIRLWIEQGALNSVCPEITGNDPAEPVPFLARACYSRDILPVLASRCATAGCHDALTHEEGFNFTTYTSTLKAVRPGNFSESKLYKVITESSGEDKMPPSGSSQLTTAEIDSIAKWINYGALNEVCGEVCDTLNTISFSGTISPLIQLSCSGCHSGSSPSGGILLNSYTNIASVASNGLLLKALKGAGATKMPPAGSFSACRIRQFELWIDNGFLNN